MFVDVWLVCISNRLCGSRSLETFRAIARIAASLHSNLCNSTLVTNFTRAAFHQLEVVRLGKESLFLRYFPSFLSCGISFVKKKVSSCFTLSLSSFPTHTRLVIFFLQNFSHYVRLEKIFTRLFTLPDFSLLFFPTSGLSFTVTLIQEGEVHLGRMENLHQ